MKKQNQPTQGDNVFNVLSTLVNSASDDSFKIVLKDNRKHNELIEDVKEFVEEFRIRYDNIPETKEDLEDLYESISLKIVKRVEEDHE